MTTRRTSLAPRALAQVALIACLLAIGACDTKAPPVDGSGIFTDVEHRFGLEGAKTDIRKDIIADIDAATTSIDIAFSRMTDDSVADALIAAAKRGVKVRVVSDDAAQLDSGFRKLTAESLDTLDVVFGDGELVYLPDPTLPSLLEDCAPHEPSGSIQCVSRASGLPSLPTDGVMVRPNSFNVMSHNFVIIDTIKVWNLSSPFSDDTTLWFGMRSTSLELAQAFTREFQQMHGGVFATTLSVFNGPIKSSVVNTSYRTRVPGHAPGRTRYMHPGFLTSQGLMGVHFNPQDRLVKQVIDEIYRARGSVFLVTDTLVNDNVLDALEYKTNAGFDVRIIVRSGATINSRLRALNPHVADAKYTYLPTVLLTETEADRNGDRWPRRAMMLTHPMWNGAPFEVLDVAAAAAEGIQTTDDIVRVYPSDMFADGALITLHDFLGGEETRATTPDVDDPIERLTGLIKGLWDSSTPVNN